MSDRSETPTQPRPPAVGGDASRRSFLKTLCATGAACGVVPLGACGPSGPGDEPVAAGNIADLAEGVVRAVDGQVLAIGRDVDGVWAMTLTCTHTGCDIGAGTVEAAGLECPCHGSTFTADGGNVEGPAQDPLDNYAVTIGDDGEITIDPTTVVDAGTRTAVPETT